MVVGVWKDAEGGGAKGQCKARIGRPQRPCQGITGAAMNFLPKGIFASDGFFSSLVGGREGGISPPVAATEHLIFLGIFVANFPLELLCIRVLLVSCGFWACDADASIQDLAELPAIQMDAVEAGWACFIWCGGGGVG